MSGSILDRIFTEKRAEVARATELVPISQMQERASQQSAPRGFLRSLQGHEGLALIAEVKQGSPSQGTIRANFDPVELAKTYERAGAHALSVLTDGPNFGGSLAHLQAVRDAVQLPLLRKDFLYDPYQVYEARAYGADAILLILASLSDDQAGELHGLSLDLGMDVLVETHTEEEVHRALELGATLIGVNNRDLRTFETRIETSEALLPLIRPFALPVSESALGSRADLDRVGRAGAVAVLIGTRFAGSSDVESAVREVMGWPSA